MKYIFTALLILMCLSCNSKEQKQIIMPMDNIKENKPQGDYQKIFIETNNIDTYNDNNTFALSIIIFSADGCVACAKMKEAVSRSSEAVSIIKSNYKAYLVNISLYDNFNINGQHLNLSRLKSKFLIAGTPTTVVMYGNKTLFIYPGYIEEKRFISLLKYFLNKDLYYLSREDIMKQLMNKN